MKELKEKRASGALYLVFGLLYVSLFGCPTVFASQTYYPPVVLYAQTDMWRTSLVVTAREPVDVPVSNCVIGPAPRVTLAVGESKRIDDFGLLQCSSVGYVITDLRDAVSILTFNNGSSYSYFAVPTLIKGLPFGASGTIPAVINDAGLHTYLVFVNTGPTTSAKVVVRDAANQIIGVESVTLNSGVTFHPLVTPVVIGRLEITNGDVIGTPVPPSGAVYAFAAIGPASGASQRVEVLE